MSGPWNGVYVNTMRCDMDYDCAPDGLINVHVDYENNRSWFVEVLGTVAEINGTTPYSQAEMPLCGSCI